jgi:hypothetical protein
MSTGVESLSSESSVAAALEQAFSDAPPPEKEPVAPAEAAAEEAPLLPEEEAPEEVAEEEAPAEPVFEIEIDGRPEIIEGSERVKEVLQRGIKAQRAHEENARVREALTFQANLQREASEFLNASMGEIAELRSLDARLEEWNKVDWAAAFDSDPFQAMKLKEQRDQLREARNTKYHQLNQKHEQFKQSQNHGHAQRARAEEAALLARVPEWRNAEKATPEKQAIVRDLADHYGFTPDEIGSLIDHRMLLVARDAAKYRELMRNKDQRVKQVRTAPPVVKPGAQSKPNPQAQFTKVKAHVRKLGQQGNSKGQEALVTEMLNRTFKMS